MKYQGGNLYFVSSQAVADKSEQIDLVTFLAFSTSIVDVHTIRAGEFRSKEDASVVHDKHPAIPFGVERFIGL